MTVQNKALPGEKLAGNLDTSLLKVLALVFMLIDHMGASMFGSYPTMRVIGRMALPLYAWCLVVGSVKTRDPLRYGLRLVLLAALSQPLYMMALNHTWKDMNILFLLTLGLVAIQGIRQKRWFSQFWAPALCYLALGFLKIDYGWRGLTFIILLYLVRDTRRGLVAAYIAYALFWGQGSSAVDGMFGVPFAFLGWPGVGAPLSALFRLQGMIWLSLPLIVIPTHSDLHMPRWMGYALYPAHLVVLILLRLTVGGVPLATLVRGF